MREFKFRAWIPKEKSMLSDMTYNALVDARLNNRNSWKRTDWIKMQYTGMQDIENKDIYEGDIIAFRYPPSFKRIGTVVFRDGCFDVEFLHSVHLKDGTIRKWDYLKVFVANGGVQILGNIYENSNLLEITS